MDEEGLLAFARRFDPQPIHADAELLNQEDRVVLSLKAMNMLRLRRGS